MHPEVEKLVGYLDEASSILRDHNMKLWADWLSKDADLLRRSDFYGIVHLRSAFGGMGSLNDVNLVLADPENPKLLATSNADSHFQKLLDKIRNLSGKIFDEEQ